MRLRTKSSKVILCLLCVLVCLSFAACSAGAEGEKEASQVSNSSSVDVSTEEPSSGNTSPEDTSLDLPVNEADLSLPGDITMELFGVNLLKMNRPSWEERIFSLKEKEEETTVYISFTIGDYIVTHTRKGFQNEGNFSSWLEYNGILSCAHLQFDENDNLSKIEMSEDLGKEFSTSFLRISDNPKEYLESLKPGVWDRLLGGELLTTKQGWVMYYNGDTLQIATQDILLSYILKDELVDYIMVSTIGEPPQKDEIPLESGIYALDRFDYFLDGKDIAKMSMSEWVNLFDFSRDKEFKEMLMNIMDTSKKYFEETNTIYCDTKMIGKNVGVSLSYSEYYGSKSLHINMWHKDGEYSEDNKCYISFSIRDEGYIQMDMMVRGKFPMIIKIRSI